MPRAYRYVALTALLLAATISLSLGRMRPGETLQADPGAEGKYAKYIFYDVKPLDLPPETMAKIQEEQKKEQSMVDAYHLLNLDTTRTEGAPYLDFVWLFKGTAKGYAEKEHVHDFDEFLGFVGSSGRENPRDLGGEIEVWLGGEKYAITKSCLIYVPKGVRHCPVRFTRIDTPVLFFTGGMATSYSRTATEFKSDKAAQRNFAKYISYDVNPEKISPETTKKWDELGKKNSSTVEGMRFLDLDSVDGAPYIDFVRLWKGSEKGPNHPEHAHEWGEVFGFIGMNPKEDPHDLGGEIEFYLNGEKHLITRSSLIWVPPGLKHCPIQFNRIDKPFLLFTLGMTRKYSIKN
jgi:quercetin dioxygenase-like cupin family protein